MTMSTKGLRDCAECGIFIAVGVEYYLSTACNRCYCYPCFKKNPFIRFVHFPATGGELPSKTDSLSINLERKKHNE